MCNLPRTVSTHFLFPRVLIGITKQADQSSIKFELHDRYEATERSIVLTTKELLSLLDNHVSITEVALEMTN